MPKAAGESVSSQELVMSDSSKWKLQVFPGGFSDRQRGFISVEVVLLENDIVPFSSKHETTATFTISILGHKDNKQAHDPQHDILFSFKSPSAIPFNLLDEDRHTWSIDNFLPTQDVEDKFLANDSVIFAVEIEVLGRPELLVTNMPSQGAQVILFKKTSYISLV